MDSREDGLRSAEEVDEIGGVRVADDDAAELRDAGIVWDAFAGIFPLGVSDEDDPE